MSITGKKTLHFNPSEEAMFTEKHFSVQYF